MAQKRMFSLNVVDTDKFLEMPVSARLLYYDLGMRADDDGFIDNWKKILVFTGLKEDDLKILIAKQFIIPFESGVIVIKHWRLNNYLQNDRLKPTIYQEEKSNLSLGKDNVYTLDTKCIHSIDKISIDKNSISVVEEENKEEETTTTSKEIEDVKNEDVTLLEFTEKIFGRPLGGTEIEVINTWEDNELTRYAIKQSELARAFNVRYISRILYAYKKENIKTVAEAEEREKNFQESKTTVNKTLEQSKKLKQWENISKKEASPEEINELKTLLNEENKEKE